MRTKVILALLLFTTALLPASAHAAKTCLDVYYQCLNETQGTKGIERILADVECGARYYGCLRDIVT